MNSEDNKKMKKSLSLLKIKGVAGTTWPEKRACVSQVKLVSISK